MGKKMKLLSAQERTPIEESGNLRIVDELYGYTVRPGGSARRRATLVEWAAHFVGFGLLFGTFGLIIAPGGLNGANLDVFEIGIAVAFVAVSVVFFWIGTRGTAVEIQVDQIRQELRTAVRNWRGRMKVMETYSFGNIESLFVHKRSQRAETGKLCIGTYSEPRGIELIEAGAAELRHLYKALARGMRPETQATTAATQAA